MALKKTPTKPSSKRIHPVYIRTHAVILCSCADLYSAAYIVYTCAQRAPLSGTADRIDNALTRYGANECRLCEGQLWKPRERNLAMGVSRLASQPFRRGPQRRRRTNRRLCGLGLVQLKTLRRDVLCIAKGRALLWRVYWSFALFVKMVMP